MSRDALIEQFTARAEAEAASVMLLPAAAHVPGAVAAYLSARGLPPVIHATKGGILADINWRKASELQRTSGDLTADGQTCVTGCYAGIAESGSTVVVSSGDHPSEYNFLPATHIVVMPTADLVADFEALWARLRADFPPDRMPRLMNFISGPSRTADLGLPSKHGAHGPARVHILLIDH